MNFLPLSSTQIEGGFWGRWQIANQQATIPAMYKQMADTGRIEAFKLNWKPGMPNPPHIFWDSDVAKWIEAASYTLVTHPNPESGSAARRGDRPDRRRPAAGWLPEHALTPWSSRASAGPTCATATSCTAPGT